jgi:exopolyphosphatase/guanosine-5'-triphosphate,3'-diphosphate pyrophosphatase
VSDATLQRRRAQGLTADRSARIAGVQVGTVDVGANTVRLLVAARDGDRLVALREERIQLGLGEEIERTGAVSEEKVEETALAAALRVRRARKLGCAAIEVLLTSPGRQATNGRELAARVADATGAVTRVLTAQEEGVLAWRGAVAAAGDVPSTVAVCDVGGGSAQIAVGSLLDGPAWVRSVDIGSLRLTRRVFGEDPPTDADLERAAHVIEASFAELTPPLPLAAIAVGGTARALKRVAGDTLGPEELDDAVQELSAKTSRQIAKTYRLDRQRARTITGGALILAEIQRRLSVPLEIGRGGLREGAAHTLLDATVAATA